MNAYIFDVDGVITDPEKRVIDHPEIITLIVNLLLAKNTVAFISGRALPWLKERLLNDFYSYIKINNLDIAIFNNVFISGEFGGSNIFFENGALKENINLELRLESELVKQATDATKQFSDIVFIDKDKQTQFTAEMQNETTVVDFAKHEHEIANSFTKIVRKLGLEETVEVQEDRIAINIKCRLANKMLATKQFLDWLSFKNFHPEKIKAFGDSVSDLEIGHELRKNNLNFDFIYVGNPQDIKHDINFPIISTLQKFGKETDEGTLEYLKTE
jgi:histidinol phosphatase-like enzyme